MTAKEIREYRNVSKKLVEVEERSKMLEKLKKHKVCFSEEEGFVRDMGSKMKILGNKRSVKTKQHEEFVSLALKYKLRDNALLGTKLRKRRDWLRRKIEENLGSRSSQCRRLVDEVKTYAIAHRGKVKLKNKKKVEHLISKFGKKRKDDLDMNVVKCMGNPRIFCEEEVLSPEVVRDPVVVLREGESIQLSDDEREVLKLGPKFCLYTILNEEEFETNVEESIMKIKWDLMGEDKKPKAGKENIALRILLGDEVCEDIDDELEEEQEIVDAETRNIFDNVKKEFNFAKRRATDLKGNSRVFFPSKARSLEDEAKLETMRLELKTVFKYYVSKFCQEGGKQMDNMSTNQAKGLKSLRKRVSNGELVIIPTDKSGRIAVMTLEAYKEAGLKHTLKDKEVSWQDIKESQRELNGHVSMMVKIFKIGGYWKHGQRVRETTMGEGLSICPMSLLYKDHKGWSPGGGSVPPTRPVVGGHRGINMHLSELVSDIIDPVVCNYAGGGRSLALKTWWPGLRG